jgi:hypothetical protein
VVVREAFSGVSAMADTSSNPRDVPVATLRGIKAAGDRIAGGPEVAAPQTEAASAATIYPITQARLLNSYWRAIQKIENETAQSSPNVLTTSRGRKVRSRASDVWWTSSVSSPSRGTSSTSSPANNSKSFFTFEPIAALLAAYELIRRGRREHLQETVRNLREFFGQLPDVEALARMADMDWRMPSRPPLLLDGFLALNLPADKLPMPNEALDFRGPWTLWQGD